MLTVALLLAATGAALALPIPPPPPRFVHDGAGLLSPSDRERVEAKLGELNAQQGLQVGVIIMPSLEGEILEEYTRKVGEAWKPGLRGKDDGVIVAIFPNDRKVRIEVGTDLEGAIPDAIAARLIRNALGPAFRQGRYADGLVAVLDGLGAAARGDTAPLGPDERRPVRDLRPALPLLFGFIVLVILASMAARRSALSREIYRRGKRVGTGSGPWWFPPSGGGWGGGGGGGFGGGGGGFSGGGGFGGGGASGGW